MGRLRAVSGGLAAILLSAAQAAFAVPAAMQAEPAMQLTLQLSVPSASEPERDLLRREYRLVQSSSEFWAGFDSLNARIHGATDLLRSLRGRVEGVPPPAARPQPLMAGLEAGVAQPAPALARMPAPSAPSQAAEPGSGTEWLMLAAVLGGLTLLLGGRRRAGRQNPVAALAPPAAPATSDPAAFPAGGGEGLRRHTVPAPEPAPVRPVDPVREEMDHALDLAEVMLSYGRTTGAMQTLKDYLHAYPTASVRPWLKLLDLHRQTGMREDFERAAGTVHSHFNVRVPSWDEGVAEMPLRSFFDDEEHTEILGLEQLPHILAKVQAAWPDASCLEYLRHLLVDNRGGDRMGFPVSVVSEILLLEDVLNGRLAGHASPN